MQLGRHSPGICLHARNLRNDIHISIRIDVGMTVKVIAARNRYLHMTGKVLRRSGFGTYLVELENKLQVRISGSELIRWPNS